MRLSITPQMVLELFADQTPEDAEEKLGLYVGPEGWTVGVTPQDLPDGLPTSLASVYSPGVVLHRGPALITQEDALAKFVSDRYAIPFEDGTVREPMPDEIPEIAFTAGLKQFEPGECWWFDADRATLMAAEHEDLGSRYSIRRTFGGRYVETEHDDDPDAAWYLAFQVPRSLAAAAAAKRLLEWYPHVSDDTDPQRMSASLSVAFQVGRMMSSFSTDLVKVPGVNRDLRGSAYRIAHAKQQFADAGDLAEVVRNELLPMLRMERVYALRDLLQELEKHSERPSTFEELLPQAAEMLDVSLRTATEMFKQG